MVFHLEEGGAPNGHVKRTFTTHLLWVLFAGKGQHRWQIISHHFSRKKEQAQNFSKMEIHAEWHGAGQQPVVNGRRCPGRIIPAGRAGRRCPCPNEI